MTTKDGTADLAKMVRDEYAQRGLTQTQAAEIIGVKQQTFSRWANGKLSPSQESLPRLARFLHISVAELRKLRAESSRSASLDQVAERLGGMEQSIRALAREVRRLADGLDS